MINKSDEDLTRRLKRFASQFICFAGADWSFGNQRALGFQPGAGYATSTQIQFRQPQNIYLGSASTTNTTLADTAAAVQLNASDYPSDVHAVLEASLSIVGGGVWARLKTTTTGAILSVTEIFNNSANGYLENFPQLATAQRQQ